jgi:DNA phosphorothioation-associated putative methyltransferase
LACCPRLYAWTSGPLGGDYQTALQAGLKLLYASGDPSKIQSACKDPDLGWQDEQALYVHRDLLERLPPVLQAYVGCATTLLGDMEQVDVIKIHKASEKVTFLTYDDFEGKPIPELQRRVKVNLRTRRVETFNHSQSGQCLYFKERFVRLDHPRFAEMKAFSTKLRKLGITDQILAAHEK